MEKPIGRDDFLTDFQHEWDALPTEEWNCDPADWKRVHAELERGLQRLSQFSKDESLMWVEAPVRTWMKKLLRACGLGVTIEGMSAIVDLILQAHPQVLEHLGIGDGDARIFLRAGAELGDQEMMIKTLAHLRDAGRHEVREALTRHFVEIQRISGVNGMGQAHIVFHDVTEAPDKHRKLQLKPFIELVGLPLPVVGRVDTGVLAQLRRDCPWMEPVIRVLERQIEGILLGWSGFQLSPLLLVGPPGAGKSWFVHRLGELLDLPVLVINAAGSADNMALKGAARGWGTERPGMLVEFIARKKVANPLVVVDEIDKVAEGRQNGNLLDTLHQLLEPENARQWRDEFLLGRCDLSRVNWIATANGIAHLPASLLSRFQVIEVPAPGKAHRPQMLHSVLRQIARERQTGFDIAAWLDDAEWQFLLDRGKTPRLMRRLAEALLGYKIREIRQRLH